MLKIGDFSKLAQVSAKTLRHYGKLGLLKPAWIDRFTGYRYYTVDQLPRLSRILALKDLGFSLEQIGRLLHEDLSAAELRGMMRLKHAELERHVQAEQARLTRVEARLRQIEQEGTMPDYEVVLKSIAPQRVVGIRKILPGYRDVMGLFEELRACLRAYNVAVLAARPSLAIYYDAEFRDQGVDAEAAAPLSGRWPGTSRTVVHELPGIEMMACIVHQGGYEMLPRAYKTVLSWIEENGYRVTGPNRDVYLQAPEPGLGVVMAREAVDYVTEVQFPIEEKPESTFVIQMKESSGMEPKIVTKPAFTVVGLLYHGKNENNEIAQMWGEFIPRLGEVQHKVEKHGTFGVCGNTDPEGAFDYVAGVAVNSVADVPEGMVDWVVEESKYAVFSCTLGTIHQAYEYAFKTWLPGSDHERGDGPDFELYDEKFDPETGGPLYIYVPIK